jgi:hypothetical protein
MVWGLKQLSNGLVPEALPQDVHSEGNCKAQYANMTLITWLLL